MNRSRNLPEYRRCKIRVTYSLIIMDSARNCCSVVGAANRTCLFLPVYTILYGMRVLTSRYSFNHFNRFYRVLTSRYPFILLIDSLRTVDCIFYKGKE